MKPLYHRVAGLDVHRMLLVLTVLVERGDGSLSKHQRSFGSFKRDLRELVAWLQAQPSAKIVLIDLHWYEHCYGALDTARAVREARPDVWVVLVGL